MTTLPDCPSQVGEYRIIDFIGAGTFAKVAKAQHIILKNLVAIKIIPRNNFSDREHQARFEREVRLLESMDHPFISEFFEVIQDDHNYYIIMEYVSNGSLLDFVNKTSGLEEADAKHYFGQMVHVLEYLHVTKNVMHRDLKAENVLLDKYDNIRLIDFGLSNIYSNEEPFLKTACGSPAYASPEMIRGHHYSNKSDIWSLGILLYAMVVGRLPFNDSNVQRLLRTIVTKEPFYPESLSPALKHLLQHLLDKDPDTRYTLDLIKRHPWFSMCEYSKLNTEDNKIDPEFKVMKSILKGEMVDESVVQKLVEANYNTSDLLENLKSKSSNHVTALYRMLKKEKIADMLEQLSFQSCVYDLNATPFNPKDYEELRTPLINVSNSRRFSSPAVMRKADLSLKILPNGSSTKVSVVIPTIFKARPLIGQMRASGMDRRQTQELFTKMNIRSRNRVYPLRTF